MKYGLPPIIDHNCKILILGSLPGEVSLREQQYYAYPANQFWSIIFTVFNEEMPDSYQQKCDSLLRHGIGLWDSVHCAEREGSLDSNIRNAIANDFDSLFQKYPDIGMILFNGRKAEEIFRRHHKNLRLPTIALPSTSPIPGRNVRSFEEKVELWREAIKKIL